jgi:hypothetical protein
MNNAVMGYTIDHGKWSASIKDNEPGTKLDNL